VQKIRVFATAWLFLSLLLQSLPGQELELTSDKPIEFDEANHRMIATGEAALTYGDLILKANRIVYDQENNIAEATGNIRLSQDGYRALADRVKVNTETLFVEAYEVRLGAHPIYAEADTAIGDDKRLELKNARVYYLEPDRFSPQLQLESLVVENGEILDGEKVKFKLLGMPVWYLPGFRIPTDVEPFSVKARAGNSGELGVYLQTEWLFPLNNGFYLGGNFDGYTDRGLLYGPAMRYHSENTESGTFTNSYLTSGYINDFGNKGMDAFGAPVDEDRWFLRGFHQQKFDVHQFLQGVLNAQSDTEVLRDFREGDFENNQQPESFLEYIYQDDHWSFSGFLRPNLNRFDFPSSAFGVDTDPNPIVERLPELRFELYPIELGDSGIYESAWASAGYQRYELPFAYMKDQTVDYAKFEAYYGLEKPFQLGKAVSGKLIAGGRISHWDGFDQYTLLGFDAGYGLVMNIEEGINHTQFTGEVGLDLEANFFRTWELKKPVWKINGIKHVVTPYLNYRWNPVEDPFLYSEADGVDRFAMDTNRPAIDLSTRRDSASLYDQHFVRFGIKNEWFTRHEDFGARELVRFDLSTDYFFNGPVNYDFSYVYAGLDFKPASWIDLSVDSRWSTDSLEIAEWNTHLTIHDGSKWYLRYTNAYTSLPYGFGWQGMTPSYLTSTYNNMVANGYSDEAAWALMETFYGYSNATVDQHLMEFGYRLNDAFRVRARIRYDVQLDSFVEQRLSLYQQLGKAFELEYAVVYREGAIREDDWSFLVGLELLSF